MADLDANFDTYAASFENALPGIADAFEQAWPTASHLLGQQQLRWWHERALEISKWGRGAEPVIAWLNYAPILLNSNAEAAQSVWYTLLKFQKSINNKSIPALLEALTKFLTVKPDAPAEFEALIDTIAWLESASTVSIHGRQAVEPSAALPPFFAMLPRLANVLDAKGIRQWCQFGIQTSQQRPDYLSTYFALETKDSSAALQRFRPGAKLHEYEKRIRYFIQALWGQDPDITAVEPPREELSFTVPAMDDSLLGLPAILDVESQLTPLQRYSLMAAHMVAHQRYSESMVADNWSPLQRMAVEWFEDIRVDEKLCNEFPGLRTWMQTIHPDAWIEQCDTSHYSAVRHRVAVFSAAVLYRQPERLGHSKGFAFYEPFIKALEADISARDLASMALRFVAVTREQSDQQPTVYFDHTLVEWRDDNRHLWTFIEEGDEEDTQPSQSNHQEDVSELPPQLYPEWDYQTETERPDWVSLYARLHASGAASEIDQLLDNHKGLANRLRQVLDLLKPQDRYRVRHLEFGSDLDLDIALQAYTDWRGGHTPDPRIEQHHVTGGRDIATSLLMDLSASLNDPIEGSDKTILSVSQEAVALLGWAMDALNDDFSIAGFQSNTRDQVLYSHIKGFSESWDDSIKARLAAIEPAYSTRMGAALRHAGEGLKARKNAKKLLLILTDGEPSDIDVSDPDYLIADARHAVTQLQAQGIFVWCIHLDPKTEEQTRAVFGDHTTIVDRIESLPEALTSLFLRLTN